MLPHPPPQLPMLRMTPIPQRLKQMSISPNTTAIFGRASTCTIQAAWNNHILNQGLNVFHRNHVLPTIPKIILVDKASPFLTSNRAESYTSIILHRVAILWIWLSIVCFAGDKLMKVRVLPPHYYLEHLMQAKERSLTQNHNASPYRRCNFRQPYLHSLNTNIKNTSPHPYTLRLPPLPPLHPH